VFLAEHWKVRFLPPEPLRFAAQEKKEQNIMAHVVAQGSFLARALTGSSGTDNKGRLTARVEFELLAGPDSGQRITYSGLINAKSAKYVGPDLKAVGWKCDTLKTLSADVSAMHAEVVIEIEHKSANDPKDPERVFAVVRSIARGAAALKPPSTEELNDADEALRSVMGDLPF